jgi:hypothetical protein
VNEQEIIGSVTRALHRGTRELDAATVARLSALRHHALTHADTPIRSGSGTLAWPRRHAWIAALLVILLLFAGWTYMRQQELASGVDTDLLLLTGELPPGVYADRVFAPWLQGYRR